MLCVRARTNTVNENDGYDAGAARSGRKMKIVVARRAVITPKRAHSEPRRTNDCRIAVGVARSWSAPRRLAGRADPARTSRPPTHAHAHARHLCALRCPKTVSERVRRRGQNKKTTTTTTKTAICHIIIIILCRGGGAPSKLNIIRDI